MSRRWNLSEIVSPLPLAAVALLAINDAWLKPTFHNHLTGKLSDLAGCFVFPLYLAALLGVLLPALVPRRRLLAGGLATAALFATLELWPAAAVTFCAVNAEVARWIGIDRAFRLTSDPTDLLALVMVPVAYLFGVRRASAAATT